MLCLEVLETKRSVWTLLRATWKNGTVGKFWNACAPAEEFLSVEMQKCSLYKSVSESGLHEGCEECERDR